MMKINFFTEKSVPDWQSLKETNVSKATRMAVDLIEKKRSCLYRSTVKAHFSKNPPYMNEVIRDLSHIDPTYPCRFLDILAEQ